MIKNSIKITINLIVGGLILVSPVAYGTGLCTGGSCCCAPERTDGLSFNRGSCCPCGTIETQEKPVQEAVIESKITHQPIRPELDLIESETQNSNIDFSFSNNNHSISIHSPPLDIGLLFTPLLC